MNLKSSAIFSAAAVIVMCSYSDLHAKNKISGIEVKSSARSTVIKVKYTEKAQYVSYMLLEKPYRVLLDLSKKKVYSDEGDVEINRGALKEIRFEYKKSNLKEKPLEYIIFELNDMCTLDVETKRKLLVLKLNKISSGMSDLKYSGMKVKLKDLKGALEIGVSNNPSIKIAIDEIELAKLKKWEALRAIYPGLTAKYEQTRGDAIRETGVPEFDEKTFGLQLNQSLYYGRKLISTYRQAKHNYEIAKLKYDDLMLSFVFEVKKAYYNVIKQEKSKKLFKELSKNIKKDIKSSRKRYKMNLSTKIEYLTAETINKQISYNVSSLSMDLNLARLQLLHLLTLRKETPVKIDLYLPFSEIKAKLSQALRIAALKKPNLRIAQKEMEVGELGEIIGNSSNAFKVDLTGFAGRSGGAYKTETLEMGEDYSAGIRISKPFGGNTLNTSFMFDKTSEKLGQTTRTQSKSGSASLSLLDNIKGYSDSLEGRIGLKQAQIKLLGARNDVEKDVRESFFNLEKSILQVKATREEMNLAKEEVVATKIKKDLNLSQISELISSKLKLANSRKSYYEALAFFNTSLAALNKAVGNSNEFKVSRGKKGSK